MSVTKVKGDGRQGVWRTSQTVNGPLLKLLEGDVCGGRRRVEIESVWVLLLLVGGFDMLPLARVDMASLWIDAVVVGSEHGG